MENSSKPPPRPINLDPWRQVVAQADAFFTRAASACSDQLSCAPGCVDCCQQDLEVLAAEAVAILQGLDQAPAEVLEALAARDPGGACVMLLDGRCAVYEHRPIICRTHGLPIRYEDPDDPEAAEISCCALNFTTADPPADAVLNGNRLLTCLSVADSLVRAQMASGEAYRLPISRLLRLRWRALEKTDGGS